MLAFIRLSGLIRIDEAQRTLGSRSYAACSSTGPSAGPVSYILGSAHPIPVGLDNRAWPDASSWWSCPPDGPRRILGRRSPLAGVYRPRSRASPNEDSAACYATSPRLERSRPAWCAFRLRRCGARGRCSPTTMASSSAAQNSARSLDAAAQTTARRQFSMRSPMHSSSVS